MSIRSCIYKKCENYIDLKNMLVKNFTLFSFPKNAERRRKWIELGEVPQNVHESNYFFCSDHFDKKFLSINNRRTVLVGEALPFPYVEIESDESNRFEETDLNFVMYDLERSNTVERQEYSNDREIVVESTTITCEMEGNLNDEFDKQEAEEYLFYSEDENNKKETTTCIMAKRKPENASMQANTSKKLKTSETQKTSENFSEIPNVKITQRNLNIKNSSKGSPIFLKKETCADDINLDELIDTKHVTTFIFKSEEYVQMPKEHYISEKLELMKMMRKFKCALQAIKEQLSTVHI